jgi:PKD repeat protein
MTIRDILAKRNAGGPQFKFLPQRLVIEVGDGYSLSELAESDDVLNNDLLNRPPVSMEMMATVEKKLANVQFNTKRLDNTGVIVAEAEKLSVVVDNIQSLSDEISDKTRKEVSRLKKRAKSGRSTSLVDSFRPGLFNFEDGSDNSLEANLRNELLGDMHNPITKAVSELDGVESVEASYTYNTPGPRNLGIDVLDNARDVLNQDTDKPDVGDVLDKIGATSAWQVDTGENVVIAIFDTSFSRELLDSERVIDTFSGEDVDSAYSAPEEGHGTMTAYSAAGNKQDTEGNKKAPELSYSGVAKNAELLLARLSDSSGGLVYTMEAWDWLAGWIKSLDKPVISNHSYGIPLCSGRGVGLCSSTAANVSAALSKRDDHQAIYAAGNEATYCGHRLSGATNGIAGVNSKNESIACAAFRYDSPGAQSYSSHGLGHCGDRLSNPKPDVGCLLPTIVPYGNKEKDMSTQNGGSGAGTSEAAPLTAGVAGLIASVTGNARQSEIEGILESTANQVRRTQVNIIRGHDARFGHGQINAEEAVKQAEIFEAEEPPNPVFTYNPATPTKGSEVRFSASASTDPNGDIEEYQWDFGDGTSGTGETVTHTFEDPGEQTVILRVIDSFNNEATQTSSVYIASKPEAEFEINAEQTIIDEPITFDASVSTDRDGDIQEYRWDFGDGDTATGETVEHEYEDSGSYTVSLQVIDSLGNVDSVAKTVEVTAAPTAQFNYGPQDPMVGTAITFDGTVSTDLNDDIESYAWNFGDETMSTGSVVEHEFDSSGEYEVTLIVEDVVGNQSMVTRDVEVEAQPEPEFEVKPDMPTTSDSIEFDASMTEDPDGLIASYEWEFGDGDEETGEKATAMYDSPGMYEVMLTVEDEDGNINTETKSITVSQAVGAGSQ